MNYEKAYKEALERAREFQKSKDGLCVLTAESIFPELKESEDEKIRKALIRVLNENVGNGIEKYGAKLEDALAWLEKQGEQKHTDRVEPKFKVGDIVKFDRPSAMLKREILSIDFENERYLTRRTDIGGAIKEFIYFCEQDDYVIVGSHNNNPSLEDKVSILADEIIALKERVKALEIQVIKQCSDKNRLDSLESKMIILDSYNINNRLDALESSVLEEGK